MVESRKVFGDSVVPISGDVTLAPHGLIAQAAQAGHRTESMTILFSMDVDEQAALEDKVARGETVTYDELQRDYAPRSEDAERLIGWLQHEGYTDIHRSADRTGVYATATISQIEKSLDVNMARVTKGGLTYTAATNAPSLPISVGDKVSTIAGLQPFRRAQKHFRMRLPQRHNRLGAAPSDEVAPAPNVANAAPYLVSEILGAYGAGGLPVTGRGQTIAILIDTFPSDADVGAFWTHNQIPHAPARIEKVNVKQTHLPAIEGEETLDVQWASGIARDAQVRVYASGSLAFVDLDLALDRIIADVPKTPGMRQLSISLGLGETFFGGARGEIAAQHKKLLRLAALGVNVFVSSGDAGSNPDDTGHGSRGPLQTEYESSDPCVIAVGGTSLKLAPDGTVASETAWVGSGGGASAYFARPSWQRGAAMPTGSKRLVPDVSLAADPEEGAFLILHQKVTQIGGTSWSAPVWAGFCALINEARVTAGKPPLPFLNPLIYPLRNSPCFRDVQDGTNGGYRASRGYDMVTGLGVPNLRELIAALTR